MSENGCHLHSAAAPASVCITGCADRACCANPFTASDAGRTRARRDAGQADGFEPGGYDIGRL
jgi:hypothetical protein